MENVLFDTPIIDAVGSVMIFVQLPEKTMVDDSLSVGVSRAIRK